MGLKRKTIHAVVDSAFKSLGDIVESCTHRVSSSTYSPSTGTNIISTTDATIKAIFTSYKQFEVDRISILTKDVKMICKQSDFATIPIPATDSIIRSDGSTYNIISVQGDPAGATYIIQLRAP